MKAPLSVYIALLTGLLMALQARADDLRAAMEADNTRWLVAYNTNNPAAFAAMYTQDAVVLPPSAPPVNGREAIEKFWADRLKPGNRKDHTFEIVSIQQDGRYAYQVARFTVIVINDKGERTKMAGKHGPHLRASGRR